MNINRSIVIFVWCTLFVVGCNKKDQETNWTYQISKVKHSYIATNQELNLKLHERLNWWDTKTSEFGVIPSTANFVKIKSAWQDCYKQFHMAKPAFYGNQSIMNDFSISLDKVNLSHFDPSYIDYTAANPNFGIITDTTGYPDVNTSLVNSWNIYNGSSDESQITLGFHVFEFLAWGENGQRTNDDFISWNTINDRRRTFIKSVQVLIRQELESTKWNQSIDNQILAMSNEDFIEFVFSGIFRLLDEDLIGRTLKSPYNSQNKIDVLSKFSNNTKLDILNMIEAISTILDGRTTLEEHNNYFLGNLLAEIDQEKYDSLMADLQDCYDLCQSISGSFSSAIITSSERIKIDSIISKLSAISITLKDYKTELGFN